VAVSAGSVQDRHAGHALIGALSTCYQRISHVWADGGYSGALVTWSATRAITLQIVGKIAGQIGFQVSTPTLGRRKHIVMDHLPPTHRARLRTPPTTPRRHRPLGNDHHHDPTSRPTTPS
jgi:hypothetical protein